MAGVRGANQPSWTRAEIVQTCGLTQAKLIDALYTAMRGNAGAPAAAHKGAAAGGAMASAKRTRSPTKTKAKTAGM
jgi:hypothetical protein